MSSRRVASGPGASPSEVSCRRALLTSRIRILASTCLARCWHNVSASKSQWSFLRCWSAAADSCKSSNQSPCKKRRILSENTFSPCRLSPVWEQAASVGRVSQASTTLCCGNGATLSKPPRTPSGGNHGTNVEGPALSAPVCVALLASLRFPAGATLVLACTHSRAAPLARCGVRAGWPCRLAAGARRQGLLLESHLARSAGVVAVSQGGER